MPHHILIVDDDPAILEVLASQFRDFEVTTAASAEEALLALRRNGTELVIADVRMPGVDGVSLLETIRKTRPDVARFVLTAFTDAHAVAAAQAEDGVYRFKKPWSDELLVTVRRALENRDTILTLRRRVGLLLNWMEMAPDLASRTSPEEILATLGRWLARLPGVSGVDVYIVRPAVLECVHAAGSLKDVPLCRTDDPLVRALATSRTSRRVGKSLESIRVVGESATRGVVRMLTHPGDAEIPCLIDQALALTALALRSLPAVQPQALLPESFDLRLLQRQATLGALFASVIHEMNNPLGAVLAHLEMLQADCPNHPVVTRHLSVLIPQMERIASILDRARKLAHPPAEEFSPTDLADTVRPVVALLDYHFRAQGCTISLDLPDSPVLILGSSPLLQQVWLNLIKNACEAIAASPRRRGSIRVRLSSDPAARTATLTVADDGLGMSSDTLRRLRSRPEFSTTKPDGLGLGRYESRRIILQHGGSLDYESKAGEGTTAIVTFKLVS